MTGPAPKLLPLRIRLPYTGEEEFIERYGSNVGRGGVFVATRALKPEGTGLAFEFVLADGTRLLRGEGVVLKAQPDAGAARTGMTVRFTKLDAASKALIDRIVARRSGPEAPMASPATAPLPPGLVRRTPAARPVTPVPVPEVAREEVRTPKASMTLPAVKLPVVEAPPDLAEPDEPVSLFPEHAAEEEEELAPLPAVDFPRKPRKRPVGPDEQRATQEMFTVQPRPPAPVEAPATERTPAASGTFAAVMPPPVEAGWVAEPPRVEAPEGASTASEADDGRADAAWNATGAEARADEALAPELGAPAPGEAFTPASVDAFDPNAVLGATHSEWSSASAIGEAEPARGEANSVSGEPQTDADPSFDVDLSMEPDEAPLPEEPGPSFASDAHATEPEATLPSETSDSDAEGVDTGAALAPEEPFAATTGSDTGEDLSQTTPQAEDFPSTDASGSDAVEEAPLPESAATSSQWEADRLRAWGIDPDSLPSALSTNSEEVDPFSAALEQAVGATEPAASEDVPPPITDEQEPESSSEPVGDTHAIAALADATTASPDGPPEPISAPPQEEEDASTVVMVELPTEDAWTALVGSSSSSDATASSEEPVAADASPEPAPVQARGQDEALASALDAENHEEARSASPAALAAETTEEAPAPTVFTPPDLDSSNTLASGTEPSVEESTPLQVSAQDSSSPVASDEATQPGAREASGSVSSPSDPSPAWTDSQQASTTEQRAPSTEATAPSSSDSEQPPPQVSAAIGPTRASDAASAQEQPQPSASAATDSSRTSDTAPISTDSPQPSSTFISTASEPARPSASAATESPRAIDTAAPISTGSPQPSAPTASDSPRAIDTAASISTDSPQPSASTATESPRAFDITAPISTGSPWPSASTGPESPRAIDTAASISTGSPQPSASTATESSRTSDTAAPINTASEQPQPPATAATESSRTSDTAAHINTASEQPQPPATAATESPRTSDTAAPINTASEQPQPPATAATESPRTSDTAAPSSTASDQPLPQASPATESPRASEAAPISTGSSPILVGRSNEAAASTSTGSPHPPRTDEAAPPPPDTQSSAVSARSRRRTLFDMAPAVPATPPAAAEVVLGIDVGTSHARVAAFIDGVATPIPIPGTDGTGLPSVIAVDAGGALLVGTAALVEAARAPRRATAGLKRLLGVRARSPNLRWLSPQLPFSVATDRHGDAGVEIGDRFVAPTLLTAMLLRELHHAATTHLRRKVTRAVLCAPSHFTERQRAALREAATMAGLDVPRVLTNSAAAALAYAHGRGLARKRVLVVDLGGGGLEVCVVQVTGDDLEVVTTGGDPTLGGMDFDGRIAEALVSDLAEQGHPRPEHPLDWGPLRTLAESTKETLSSQDAVDVPLPTGPGPKLDRERVEALTADLAQRVVSVTREVLESNALSPQGLDAVLLVGGQSRAPLVRRRLEESLGVPVREDDVDARTAVVRGAALLGHALLLSETGKPAASVSEVLTSPIGVAEDAGTFRRVLERNTRLPTAKTLVIPVTVPGPLSLAFFQGTAATAVENEWLGALTLTVERPGEVEVHLELSTDGTVAFSATLPGAKRQPVTLATEDLDDASRDALIARSPFHSEPEARPGGLLSGLKKLFGRR